MSHENLLHFIIAPYKHVHAGKQEKKQGAVRKT